METGPYLTQIAQNKENESNSQQKFLRCNLLSTKNISLEPEPQKKQKQSSILTYKNINNFLPDQYYTIKKVKPGISFYKAILQGQERRKNHQNVPELKINLPQTLVLLENSHQLIYSQRGVVKVREEIGLNDFMKIVKNQKLDREQVKERDARNQESNVYCAALTAVGNGIFTDFSIVLSSQLDTRIYPKNQSQISLKFIQPFAETPNMLRLFYTPKSIKQWKPSYGYKGTNKKRINQQVFLKKHKQLYYYLLDFTKEENIVVNTVKGKALQQLQVMAQSIIQYMEFLRNVKISEIVIDFVYGADRRYYFHQIKSIKSTNPSPYILHSISQQNQHYKQQINQIQCKLCTFSFPKSQIKYRVTNKLLLQLYIHLKNRGDTTFISVNSDMEFITKNKYNNLTGLSNVCDLCYEIVVAENKLIMLEKMFSRLVSVEPREIIRVGRVDSSEIAVGIEETQMWQWRIFFYIEKIKNFPIEEIGSQQSFTLNMKFNDFKQTFTKRLNSLPQNNSTRPRTSPGIRCPTLNSHCTPLEVIPASTASGITRSKQSNYRSDKKSTLHTNATNRSQTFFLRDNSNMNIINNNIVIDFQKIKLITFYTKTQDISQVLLNQDLNFQFYFGNGYNSNGSMSTSGHGSTNMGANVKRYKGRSSTLQNFTNKKECQRHCCQVLLFGNQMEYCNMELSVGLVCDGKVSVSELDSGIQKSSKDYLFYSRSEDIRNCSPLPAEWIQVISEGLVLNNYFVQDTTTSARQARQTYQSKFQNQRSFQKDNSFLSFGTSLGAKNAKTESLRGISSNIIRKRRPIQNSNTNLLNIERKSLRNRKNQKFNNICEDIQSENQQYL